MSGEIIPFRRTASDTSIPIDPQERLHHALLALETAVTGQRAAVAEWRSALGNLQVVMQGLGDSVRRYHASLGSLGERVTTLHAQALRLQRVANAMARRV